MQGKEPDFNPPVNPIFEAAKTAAREYIEQKIREKEYPNLSQRFDPVIPGEDVPPLPEILSRPASIPASSNPLTQAVEGFRETHGTTNPLADAIKNVEGGTESESSQPISVPAERVVGGLKVIEIADPNQDIKAQVDSALQQGTETEKNLVFTTDVIEAYIRSLPYQQIKGVKVKVADIASDYNGPYTKKLTVEVAIHAKPFKLALMDTNKTLNISIVNNRRGGVHVFPVKNPFLTNNYPPEFQFFRNQLSNNPNDVLERELDQKLINENWFVEEARVVENGLMVKVNKIDYIDNQNES